MPSLGGMFGNIGKSVSGVGKAAIGSASKLGKGATKTVSKVGKAVTPGGGKSRPISGNAINTGPSQSFKTKMMGQMPGMVNGMAQNYGDPSMMGGVQNSGLALGMKRPMGMQPPPVDPNMMAGGPMDEGIVRGPSQMPFNPSGGFMPGQNSGITGGMPNPGLFQMYNQMLQQNQRPRYA